MVYSNLHTHSIYSDGNHAPREIVEQAVSQGMSAIGISDHSYTFFDTRYCIAEEKNGEYIKELRALKSEYAGKIDLLVGIELDGFSQSTFLPARRKSQETFLCCWSGIATVTTLISSLSRRSL